MREVTPRGLGRAVAVALVAMLLAAPAVLGHPPAPVDEGGRAITGKIHRWLHQANVPLVRGRVQVRRSTCPGNPLFVGCVFTARPRTLYLRHDVRSPRLVLYHELGHIFDIRVLNGASGGPSSGSPGSAHAGGTPAPCRPPSGSPTPTARAPPA